MVAKSTREMYLLTLMGVEVWRRATQSRRTINMYFLGEYIIEYINRHPKTNVFRYAEQRLLRE
jgi:hypothetical protein